MEVQNVLKCSSATKTKITSDTADLVEEYSQSISGGLNAAEGIFAGAFRGGSDFKHESKKMSTEDMTTMTATADCITHVYELNKVNPPCMSAQLQ